MLYTDHLLPDNTQGLLSMAFFAGMLLVDQTNSDEGRNSFLKMMHAPIYGGGYTEEEVTDWSNHLHDEFPLLDRGNFLITTTVKFPTFYELDSGTLFMVVMPGVMLTFLIDPEPAKLIRDSLK